MKLNTFLLFIILVIVSIILVIVFPHDQTEYTYRIDTINLKDSNYLTTMVIVDYVCDSNVYVDISNPILSNSYMFYASTWRDGIVPHSEGKCYIKIREVKKQYGN